jgi:hypothetical protein
MKRALLMPALAAAVLAGGLMTAPALGQDTGSPATIHFSGGAAGFIVGVHSGSGTLTYQGKTYPLKVSGLGVGTIGVSSFTADGTVTGLTRPQDIEGTYGAVTASATAGVGAGGIDMKNDKGVEIQAHTSSVGLKLTLAPGGVTIKLK